MLIEHLWGLILAIGWMGAALVCGYAWTNALDAAAPLSLRVLAAGALGTWLAMSVFFVLSGASAFSWLGASSLLGLSVLLTLRWRGAALARELASDRERLRRACAQVFPGWRDLQTYAAALVVAVASLRIARSLVAPPMATDALTYHLVRASRFVQTGTFAIEPTPDAGGYYAYYPPLGDVFWSWWLLAAHSDAWIGLGQACLLFALGLATFTAAEQLGAPRRIAIWAALALLATPAVLSWSSAAYVDTFVLVGFTAGIAWCPRAIRTAAPIALALPIVGFALAAGAKTTGLVPLAAGTALMLGVLLVRGRQRGMGGLAIGLPLLVVLPGLAIGLVDHGNPLYPFGLHAGPWTLSGNEENELLHRGALFPAHMVAFDPSVFLRRLFWPNFDPRVQHLNLGPVTPVLALLGCAGLIWLREGSARALTGALLVLVALAFVAKLAGPDTLTLRTSSAPAIGRFLTMPLLVIVLAASRAPAHLAVPVFALQIVCGSALGFPRGLGTVDLLALRWSSPGLLLALGLLLLSWRLRRAFCIAAAVAVLLGTTLVVRPLVREHYYAALHAGDVFDPHPVDPKAAAAWPIWAALEREPASTVAFASGWDGRGHHWYRSPLFASDLRHEVVYVSPTADGRLIDYRQEAALEAAARFEPWMARLVAAQVDILVLCVPVAPEHRWVLAHPASFEPFVQGIGNLCLSFRVRSPSTSRDLPPP